MWLKQQQRKTVEHLELVSIDGADWAALPCNCPRGEDHDRVNSHTLDGAPVEAKAEPRHRAYA